MAESSCDKLNSKYCKIFWRLRNIMCDTMAIQLSFVSINSDYQRGSYHAGAEKSISESGID